MSALRPVLLGLLPLLAFGAACGGGDGAAKRVPKGVLLLVMDTTRGDRCGFNGYTRPTTPCLDAFAKTAVVFEDCWSPATWTGPAHATLFTGLRPENHHFHAGSLAYLESSQTTLAEIMSDRNWATACLTNNDNFAEFTYNLTQGFQRVERYFQDPNRPLPHARKTHEDAVEFAAARIAEGKPFLLFVNDMEPHLPYEPPAGDQAALLRGNPSAEEVAAARKMDAPDEDLVNLGRMKLVDPRRGVLSDLYDAEIRSLDREIGTLLDRLRERKLLDDMLVVITSDHGEAIGEHDMFGHGYDLHRVIRHVPLIVRFPGRFDGGRVQTEVVRLEDVFATILDLCGFPRPAAMDGTSLAEPLAGRVARGIQGGDFKNLRDKFARSHPGVDVSRIACAMRCAYDGTLHYLWFADGRRELYDIAKDPLETDNLAPRRPADVERLDRLLPILE